MIVPPPDGRGPDLPVNALRTQAGSV